MKTTKLDGNSYFPQEEFIKRLKSDFPEIFTEDSKIDLDKLKVAFGENADLGERYGLSWKGKSEVFRTIQETTTKTLKPIRDESVDFDNTDNLFIEGDNLEALKILQRSYYGKVKMIYIDPPYNTGNDFVYNDTFAEDRKEYEQEVGIRDGNGDIREINGLCKNTKDGGHFHSNWLNMMYPRLYLARNLLRQDGVIFVSIDDNEVHNLRMIMNEIFGEENFVVELIWEKRFTRSNNAKLFANLTERILLYRKSEEVEILRDVRSDKTNSIYSNPDDDPRGHWTSVSYVNPANKNQRPNLSYFLINPVTSEKIEHPTNAWKYSKDIYEKHVKENRLYWGVKGENKYPRLKRFLSELEGGVVPVDLWTHESAGTTDQASKELEQLMARKIFDFPKPVRLTTRMLNIMTDHNGGDIVLDFFAGSGTMAHAVMQLNAEDGGNRKWIMVQLPEETEEDSEARKAGYKTIADIAKERIRRAAKKIKEGDNGQLPLENKDHDLGFKVFKVDQTNFKVWDTSVKDSEKLEKQMQEMFNTVRDDVTEEDLLFELMVKSGIELTTPREQKDGYWKIGAGELIICLADKMTQELFSLILSEKPQKVILLDRAFTQDQLKKNLTLQAEKENIEILVI